MRRVAVVSVLFGLGLSGCLGGAPTDGPSDPPMAAAWPRCEHPFPCGDGSEWPTGLAGPFERLPPVRVQVPSFDGVLLDGAFWLPDVPDGVRVPTVLYTSPYIGQCPYQYIMRQEPACLGSPENDARLAGYGFETMIEEGYAVAVFSVRGTGSSGGCYDLWGPTEQEDHAELVEWLALQPWSNGRVGMVGLSYAGTTPWEAAILAPGALKAFVVGGIVTDVYTGTFTPQGAAYSHALDFMSGTMLANSLVPPAVGEPERTLPPYAPVAHERACPEAARTFSVHQRSALEDQRDAEWFAARRLVDRFSLVTAAPLVLHGLQDISYHRFQQDVVWAALPNAPKGAVLGQWGHDTYLDEHLAGYAHGGSWLDLQLAWFDFFLKGRGPPPVQLGRVAYQVTSGEWVADTAWPPATAAHEVLYLGGETLAAQAGKEPGTLALRPVDDDSTDCTETVPTLAGAPPQRIYASAPLDEDVVVAGNPFAVLSVSADRPGGIFGMELLDADPDWDCASGGGIRRLSTGGADLRFHGGNMAGEDFPLDTPTTVRVDMHNVAGRVAAGHRIVLVVRNGDDFVGQHDDTTLTILGESHVVLPLVEGSVGGSATTMAYPPRPFAPGS